MEMEVAQETAPSPPANSNNDPSSSYSDDITPEIQLAVEEFRNFLDNAVPVLLAHPDLREYVVREANYRLEEAEQEGVSLDDISIGSDCLPTWPGLYWDPDAESVHEVLQSRLMDYQASRDLGNALRQDIILKSNRKLDEARRLGLQLQDIMIGDRLLPVWNQTATSAAETVLDELADEDLDYSSTASFSPEDNSSTSGRDSQSSSYLATVFDTSESTDDNDWSSDSSSDDSDSSVSDTIVLNNYLNSDPEYLDPDVPTNIFHDARMVNAAVGGEGAEVDLEVYIVDGDDDEVLAELFEVELVIDREGYEYHFDTNEVVEVDMPGVDIRCCSPVSDSDDTVIMYDPVPMVVDAEDELEEPQDQPMDEDDQSDVSEEVTDNEDSNGLVFEETEYGFRW